MESARETLAYYETQPWPQDIGSREDLVALVSLFEQLETLRREVSEHAAAVQHASDLQDDAETCRDQWIIMHGKLKEQLEASQRENTQLGDELGSVALHVETMRGEIRRALASIALEFYAGSRGRTAEILRSAHSSPASEAMPGKGPKAGKPRNTDSGMAVRVGPLASEESSPAKRRGDTSEEEMRDWNAHIEESWLAEPDAPSPANSPDVSERNKSGATPRSQAQSRRVTADPGLLRENQGASLRSETSDPASGPKP